MNYPRVLPVEQQLFSQPCRDIPGAVRAAVDAVLANRSLPHGARVGIAASSRGIANMALILKTAAQIFRERGAEPFIFPSMGSHGGGTAEGQAKLLDEVFHVNEKTMGCSIRSTMEVVEIGRTPEHDLPVYIDRFQAEADALLVVARVKAHTDFHGPFESGPFKMMCIGMGKKAQAESVHAFGAKGLRDLIPEVSRAKLRMAPILGALAILEDGYEQTSEINGIPADRVETEEPGLLVRAKRQQAHLPFEDLDLLVVDRMSKEISGTGMDTTVIGRRRIQGEPEWETPRIEVVFVRDLDEGGSRNAVGIGLADLTTRRLQDHADFQSTQENGLTSTFAMRLMIPVVCRHDRKAIEQAMYLLRRKQPQEIRMIRIRDTAHLERLQISEALQSEAERHPRLKIVGEPQDMRFDGDGNLMPDLVTDVWKGHDQRKAA